MWRALVAAHGVLDDGVDPGAAGIDQEARGDGSDRAVFLIAAASDATAPSSRRASVSLGADHDVGAARRGVAGVEDDETGIIDAGVGIFEALL